MIEATILSLAMTGGPYCGTCGPIEPAMRLAPAGAEVVEREPVDAVIVASTRGDLSLRLDTLSHTIHLNLRPNPIRAQPAGPDEVGNGRDAYRFYSATETGSGAGDLAVTQTPEGLHVFGYLSDGTQVSVRPGPTGQTIRTVPAPEGFELATLDPAPATFVLACVYEPRYRIELGSTAAAVAEIDRQIAEANVIYERDLNIRIKSGGHFEKQIAASSTPNAMRAFLRSASVEIYQDTTIDIANDPDVAAVHLWTTRDFMEDRGVANIGQICDLVPCMPTPSCGLFDGGAYSMTTLRPEPCGTVDPDATVFFFAHELAHVWGARHDCSIPPHLMFPALQLPSTACNILDPNYLIISASSSQFLPFVWPNKKAAIDNGCFANMGCVADYDKDSDVDADDLAIFNASFGSDDPMFDLDGDWATDNPSDFSDLLTLVSLYGPC